MAREKELFRDNLDLLRNEFRNVATIPLAHAAKYLKRDPQTLKQTKDFPIKKIGRYYAVPIVGFANWLS
jgi:hypothetical protein